MIRNEREYRITHAQAEKLRDAIEKARATGPPSNVHPKLHRASIEGMVLQLETLDRELQAYDQLQASGGKRLRGEYRDLADLLIQARIARRWTQRELAERVEVHVQKVQQYEATRFAAASVSRIGDVLQAFGAQVELKVQLADLDVSTDMRELRSAAPSPAKTRRKRTAAKV